jgi:hypothetical protein
VEIQFINIVKINIGLPIINKNPVKISRDSDTEINNKFFLIGRVSRDAVTTRNVSECIYHMLL